VKGDSLSRFFKARPDVACQKERNQAAPSTVFITTTPRVKQARADVERRSPAPASRRLPNLR
jgi:hypothetical protein